MSSPSLTGYSPNNPRRYLGPNISVPIIVTRNRAPTSADLKQPDTGKYYSFGTFWIVGKNPTTGEFGDLWYLSKIEANVSYWLMLDSIPFEPNEVMEISDDFFASEVGAASGLDQVISSQVPWLYQNILPTGTVESGHPGILASNASGTSYYILMGQSSDVARPVGELLLGGGEVSINWNFKINTLSDNTNRYILRLGLGDTFNADQSNGVYFQYSHNLFSANWARKTASGGVVSFASTGIAATTGWHNLKVIVNADATLASYFIDEVPAGTLDVNIPTGSPITPFVDMTFTSGSGVLDTLFVDLMYLSQELTSPR
jgi:hypothetical protein